MQLPKHEVHLLVGASGAGKSTILLQAVRAWEVGVEFPISFPATRVAYVTSDRGGSDLERKATRLGITTMEHYNLVDDYTVSESLLKSRHVLLETILTSKLKRDFDLLILDPIGLFLPDNLNAYREAAMGLFYLNRIAKKRGITMIGVHHTTKMKSDSDFLRPQDRISGSAALQGYSSSQIVLIEGLEKKKLHDDLYIIHHHAPQEHHQLERNEEGWFEIAAITPKKEKVAAKESLIIEIIKEKNNFAISDIISKGAELEVSEKTVKRAISTLVAEGKVIRVGSGIYSKSPAWLSYSSGMGGVVNNSAFPS